MNKTTCYVVSTKLALAVGNTALACFLFLLDIMVINTAIPRITDEFHSLANARYKVYTHFKTKPFAYRRTNSGHSYFFFAVFEIGSVVYGSAKSSAILIVGRSITGLGAAGLITGVITIVSSYAPFEKRPALLGQLGLVLGPLIGGAFTTYINVPVGSIVVSLLLFVRIPEQTPKTSPLTVLPRLHHHLDLIGFAIFAPAVIQLLLALEYGGNPFSWRSSQVIGLFIGSEETFLRWAVWSAALFNAFQMVGIFGTFYYLPVSFQAVYDTSAILSGVYVIPLIVPQLLTAGITGIVLPKTGYVWPIAFFSLVLSSVVIGLMSTLRADSSVGQWVGFQLLAGIGSSAELQGLITIQGATSGKELSQGMAFMVFTHSLSLAIALSLCNLVLVASLKREIRMNAPNVNPIAIIQAGATHFRAVVGSEELKDVIRAHAISVGHVFYLITVLTYVSGLFIWGMGRQDIRKRAENPPVVESNGKRLDK
ncbi:MFS general substrate transporter [Xylariaceae sp. FL1272]|nr:MFS general substrate transporter [Xylariaceae sp. FL1272]